MRILPSGDRAVLVVVADRDARVALATHLRRDPPPGVLDVVEGAATVLVRTAGADHLQRVVDDLRRIDDPRAATRAGTPAALDADAAAEVLLVPTTYDGPDLASLAHHLGESAEGLVARHTSMSWVVDFAGFLPGFGYLRPSDPGQPWPTVPRLATPRTRVPAGSVALAGGWTGIYPSASPGGWQLIGRTDLTTWDQFADVPAQLVPGRRVRFVEMP